MKEAVKCGALGLGFLLFLLSALLYDSRENDAKGLWTLMTSPPSSSPTIWRWGAGRRLCHRMLSDADRPCDCKIIGTITGPLLATFFTPGRLRDVRQKPAEHLAADAAFSPVLGPKGEGLKASSPGFFQAPPYRSATRPLVGHRPWPCPLPWSSAQWSALFLPLLSDHFFSSTRASACTAWAFLGRGGGPRW